MVRNCLCEQMFQARLLHRQVERVMRTSVAVGFLNKKKGDFPMYRRPKHSIKSKKMPFLRGSNQLVFRGLPACFQTLKYWWPVGCTKECKESITSESESCKIQPSFLQNNRNTRLNVKNGQLCSVTFKSSLGNSQSQRSHKKKAKKSHNS